MLRATALLLAVALVATGCTGSEPPATSSTPATSGSTQGEQSVPVSAADPATLRLDTGVEVDVPAGAASGDGRLSGTALPPPAPAPAGLAFEGPTYDLHISGATLTGQATLRFPGPSGADLTTSSEPHTAMLAYYDTGTAAWTLIPATYDDATGELVATSPHLSLWSRLTFDTQAFVGNARDALLGFFAAKGTVDQPSCPNDAAAKSAGVTVASDSGDLMKWCVGRTDAGAVVLRVSNDRHYSMETEYPAGWTMRRLGDPNTLAKRAVTAVARYLTVATPGRAAAIIPGADTVEFTVPAGTTGQLTTTPSAPAYLVDAFLYGLSTLELAYSKLPGAAVDAVKSGKALDAALSSRDCLLNLDKQVHTIVTDAASAGSVFRNAADLATGCLGAAWEVAYGVTGFNRVFVLKVILWVVDGIKLVIDGGRAVLDKVLYWGGYRIRVIAPAPAPAPVAPAGLSKGFVYAWTRHGQDLTVNADGSGQLRSRTYAEPDSGVDMYFETDTMRFTQSADGSTLTSTVTAVQDANREGAPVPLSPAHSKVGDKVSYVLKPDGALSVQPDGAFAYCRPGIEDSNCGA